MSLSLAVPSFVLNFKITGKKNRIPSDVFKGRLDQVYLHLLGSLRFPISSTEIVKFYTDCVDFGCDLWTNFKHFQKESSVLHLSLNQSISHKSPDKNPPKSPLWYPYFVLDAHYTHDQKQ